MTDFITVTMPEQIDVNSASTVDFVTITMSSEIDVNSAESAEDYVDLGLVEAFDVVMVSEGLRGPPGIQGPPGASTSYVHVEDTAKTEWVCKHNLGRYPPFIALNSAGDQCWGPFHYDSLDQMTITWPVPFSGKVYF